MKIAIVLEALTGSFITDMDKAGKEAKKQAAQMRKDWEAAGKAIGLAVAGGAAALALLTKQAINTADQMAKMSQKVGVSVEALSTLKYAADQSGVSVETLQSSLVRLTKNASDAAKGTGDAIQGFDALGISVAAADGKLKSSDALLVEIAEKFASFEDGASKTALAVNLFGKSGAELIPMLNAGASGIDKLRQRARDLGLELDTNTAKQAEQFNDLLADAANLAKGFGNDLAKSLLPALVSLAEVFVDNGIEGRKASDAVEMVSGAIKTTAGVALAGVAQVQKFGAILGMVAAQVDVFFTTIGKNFDAFRQYQRDVFDIGPIDAFVKFTETGFGNVSAALDQASGNMDALKESFSDIDDDATRKIAALNATLSSTGSAAKDAVAGVAPLLKDVRRFAAEADRIAKQNAKSQAAFNFELDRWAAELLPEAERAAAQYNIQVQKLVTDQKAGKITADQLARALELLGTEYQRNALEIEKNTRAQEIRRDVLSQVRNEYARQIALAGLSEQQRQVEIASLQAIAQWEREHGVAIDATTEAMLRQAVQGGEAMLEAARESQRAAEQSKRAWEDFAGSLADAILDGSSGVKRFWKAMLDDMKRQLVQSGLLNLLKSLFPGAGGLQMAGTGGGLSIGSLFGSLLGAGPASGGTGGALLSGLANAISGGISTGLMSLGGTLAGLGMGGLGGGLAWAGGSVAANGLLGGLGSSFMTGMGNLFGAGGGALMGIGQMIPAISAIAGVAAAIQKISGGKLFGTSYQFDSAGRQIDFTGAGVSGQDSLTEVRQRSLFRGRKWRTTNTALDAEVTGPLEEFWNAILDANSEIARRFGREAAIDVPASFKQEMDAQGNITSEIGTLLGRQYRETWEVFAKRIAAENIIANVDGFIAGIVAPVGGSGPGVGTGPGQGRLPPGVTQPLGGGGIALDATIGEASAIADRWRADAEKLLEGAQFLLLAATDLHNGFGLLGDGTLTQITDLIEDLQAPGEALSDTYARVSASAALLEQALALSGLEIAGTREEFVRFAVDIAEAAGGLEQAASLWSNYFDRFYSDTERAQLVLTQAQEAAAREFADIGLTAGDFTGEGGLQQFRELFEAALPTLSADAVVQWLEAAQALGLMIDAQELYNSTLADVEGVIGAIAQTADELARVSDILAGNEWALAAAGMTEAERAIAEVNRAYDEMQRALLENHATVEQLAQLEDQRTRALEQQAAAIQAQIDDLLGGLAWDAALAGMSDFERQMAQLGAQWDAYRDRLIELGASEAQLAQLEDLRAGAIDRLVQSQQEALAAEEAARQAQAQQLASTVNEINRAIAELGWTDDERRLQQIADQVQAYVDRLVAGGMALEDAAALAGQWAAAVQEAEEAAAEAARGAAVAELIESLTAGVEDMQLALAELGMSEYARQQAQIARETQEALARAMALGATEAELLAIEILGLDRAAAAAALSMAGFAGQIADWEFDDMLAGLSQADAQIAQAERLWEQRYLQAIEIFGEGSEEALRVMNLWQAAIGRLQDEASTAVDTAGQIESGYRSVRHDEIVAAVNRFADGLNEAVGKLIGGDAMADWLSEISGLPRLTAQTTRRAIGDVVGIIQTEYTTQIESLQQQLAQAYTRLANLGWQDQARQSIIEGQIDELEAALAAVGGNMGAALSQLRDMYLASLQPVQDYLRDMLLGDMSPLSASEQLDEAWERLNEAVAAGDAQGATQMADMYLRMLRDFEASGQDFNDGWEAVRDLLQGMLDLDPFEGLTEGLTGEEILWQTQQDINAALEAQAQAQQDANDWLARILAALEGDLPSMPPMPPGGWGVPSYDVGTYNVPATGPAILHAGEMVLPRPMADAMRQGNFGGGGDTQALEARLDAVIARLDRLDKTTAQGAQAVSQTIVTTGARSDAAADQSRQRAAREQTRRGVTA